MSFYFEYPLVLLCLFIPLFYILWRYIWFEDKRLVIPLSFDPQKLFNKKEYWSKIRYIPIFLTCLSIIFLIIGLARPRIAEPLKSKELEGIDIMILLDTSASMETKDMPPDRLAVARNVATKFLEKCVNDRIGLTIFAQDAFAYVPLTLDYGFIKNQIRDLTTDIMPKEGTALGPAISVGINRLREAGSTSKVLVLITDGVHNTGTIDPINAAMLAAKFDIRIYTITVGKDKFLTRTENQDNLTEVKTELDEETLRRISHITNGKFFRAQDEKSLEDAMFYISKLEKNNNKDENHKNIKDLYLYFALSGLTLFFISLILKFFGYSNSLEG